MMDAQLQASEDGDGRILWVGQIPAEWDMLVVPAKAKYGYVYYDSKVSQEKQEDGSLKTRVDIYEKYREPEPKSAEFLDMLGVEVVMHRLEKPAS